MTLLVALKGKDGLVLAADSRGTFGDPSGTTAQNDSQRKAHTLSPRVAVLLGGSGELASAIVLQAQQNMKGAELDGVTPVMNSFRDTARACYATWFPHMPFAAPMPGPGVSPRPEIAAIVAGYEVEDGQPTDEPRLYTLVSALGFPPMLHEYGFALQGVAQYALYILNRLFEPGRSLNDLTSLAVYAISETASQDGKVGGPIRVITITPKKGCQELDDTEVNRVIKGNLARSQALKDSFYSKDKT